MYKLKCYELPEGSKASRTTRSLKNTVRSRLPVAVPAGVAQHDEARSRASAARDARIGRGDGREDALDLDFVVGHDDENIVLAVIQQRRQVAGLLAGRFRRVHISIGVFPVVGVAQQGEDLGFEVLVRAVAVNQRHLFCLRFTRSATLSHLCDGSGASGTRASRVHPP